MSVVRKIFDGTFLQKITGRNMLFILLSVVLLVVYISLRYKCVNMVREINSLDAEIIKLKSESLAKKTDFQNTISMKELSSRLEERQIGPSKEPVKEIIIMR